MPLREEETETEGETEEEEETEVAAAVAAAAAEESWGGGHGIWGVPATRPETGGSESAESYEPSSQPSQTF